MECVTVPFRKIDLARDLFRRKFDENMVEFAAEENKKYYSVHHAYNAVLKAFYPEAIDYIGGTTTIAHRVMCETPCIDLSWDGVLKVLANVQDTGKDAENMPEPNPPYFYDKDIDFSSESVERRAREIFSSQFRNRFPGRRIKSKFANEQWDLVKDRALAMAGEELTYAAELQRKGREDRFKKYEKAREDWMTRLMEMAYAEYYLGQVLGRHE